MCLISKYWSCLEFIVIKSTSKLLLIGRSRAWWPTRTARPTSSCPGRGTRRWSSPGWCRAAKERTAQRANRGPCTRRWSPKRSGRRTLCREFGPRRLCLHIALKWILHWVYWPIFVSYHRPLPSLIVIFFSHFSISQTHYFQSVSFLFYTTITITIPCVMLRK